MAEAITNDQLLVLARRVKELLAAESQGVGELRRVTDVTGVFSLPAIDSAGGLDEIVEVAIESLKGDKGDAFGYEDFTPEQLDALSLTYERLTPEQREELRIKLADLTEEDIASLRKPATDAAAKVTAAMELISGKADLVIAATEEAKVSAIEATANARSVSDHPGYIGTDYHVYTWDYVTGAYDKTDTVLRPEGFGIYRTYASVDLMEADAANVPEGKFVLINTGSVEDADTARMYVKGAAGFDYLVDMSGAMGFTGKTPQITIGTVAGGEKPSATISEDGADIEGNPKYKLNLVLPKGPKGDDLDYSTMTPEEIAGITGKSAYEVAVGNGFTGTVAEWLASLKGETADLSDYVKKETGKGLFSGSYGDLDDKPDIPVIPGEATQSKDGLLSAADKRKLDRVGSITTATTVTGIDVCFETVNVTLSANAPLSAGKTGAECDGLETHVFVLASGGERTIAIPTEGDYVSMCGSSYSCPSGKWVEFNLKCVGGIWRIAKVEQE